MVPSSDQTQFSVEWVKHIVRNAEMDQYFERRLQVEKKIEARRLQELNQLTEKMNQRAATLLTLPIRDPAKVNTRSAVAIVTPPVAGFQVQSITPETSRVQASDTEKIETRPPSASVATFSKNQEMTKDTKRSKRDGREKYFDRRIEEQHVHLGAFVRQTVEKLCWVRDLFKLNYQQDDDEPGSFDDKLESEPWLHQSHSEQELLRAYQRGTHFISVIRQKKS